MTETILAVSYFSKYRRITGFYVDVVEDAVYYAILRDFVRIEISLNPSPQESVRTWSKEDYCKEGDAEEEDML